MHLSREDRVRLSPKDGRDMKRCLIAIHASPNDAGALYFYRSLIRLIPIDHPSVGDEANPDV